MKLLICFVSAVLFSTRLLAESPLYWYDVTVVSGTTTTSFTGASEYEPDRLASIAKDAPVKLEKLRTQGYKPGDSSVKWHPMIERKSVYLLPGTILHFFVLEGDPLLLNEEESGKAKP